MHAAAPEGRPGGGSMSKSFADKNLHSIYPHETARRPFFVVAGPERPGIAFDPYRSPGTISKRICANSSNRKCMAFFLSGIPHTTIPGEVIP